jgi:hypothetical protein
LGAATVLKNLRDLQLWDQDALSAVGRLAGAVRAFTALERLLVGYSSTPRAIVSQNMQEGEWTSRQAPADFSCLGGLPQLRGLSVVSCAMSPGALATISCITVLQDLFLSELRLPSDGEVRDELRAVLRSLGRLTTLTIRDCLSEPLRRSMLRRAGPLAAARVEVLLGASLCAAGQPTLPVLSGLITVDFQVRRLSPSEPAVPT